MLSASRQEHDPYVLQNYINKYLEKHPDEMYDVLNDILSLLDTHSMYLSSEEYSQGFSTLEALSHRCRPAGDRKRRTDR